MPDFGRLDSRPPRRQASETWPTAPCASAEKSRRHIIATLEFAAVFVRCNMLFVPIPKAAAPHPQKPMNSGIFEPYRLPVTPCPRPQHINKSNEPRRRLMGGANRLGHVADGKTAPDSRRRNMR